MLDLIIIGGSASATSAGIYAARRGLKFKIISKDFGGEVATSGEIGNWPGINQTDGITLAEQFKEHLKFYKVDTEEGVEVEKITKQPDGTFCITTKKGEPPATASEKMPALRSSEGAKKCDYEAKAVIVTTGVHPRELNVSGEKEFRNKGVSYCTVCLPPKSMIVGNNEPKAIETFKVGDRVLTDDGTYQHVLKIMSRLYAGDLVKIKSRFFLEDEVRLTPNHPVLAATLIKGKAEKYRNFVWGEPTWMPAGELSPNHLLAYPIVSELENRKTINISETIGFPKKNGFVENKNKRHTSIRVPDKINLDADFFRLAGYYLAEGSRGGYTTSFYFGSKEKLFVEDTVKLVKKYFGIKPHIKSRGSVIRVDVWSMIFSEFFDKLFSHYSYNKSLPHWVTILPLDKQKELLKGLWRGDGCRRYKDFVLVTNSPTLAAQVKNILLRFKIIPSIRKIGLEKLRSTKIDGRTITFKHPKFEITVGGPSLQKMSEILDDPHPRINTRKRICAHAHIRNGYVFLPIRKLEKEPYSGPVYNLAVSKNHSYVTTNSAVHNCDGPLFGGKVVAVIGGGNSALEAGLMMADIATKVHVINKNPQFKGDQVLIDNLKTKQNVEIIYNANTTEITGDQFVAGLKYTDQAGQTQELRVQGAFIHIGNIPNSGLVPSEVEKNQFGEIKVNANCETNIPGLYAAGDVTDVPFKQIVVAAGQGCTALLSAVNYVNKLKQ